MIRKIILLSSTFVATLSTATLIADDSHSLTGFQNPSPTPFLESALTTTNARADCQTIDNSTVTGWNTGKICLAPDIENSATNFSPPPNQEEADLVALKAVKIGGPIAAECISAGGSSQDTVSTIGFCIASDLSTSETNVQNFSFKNGLPATGMQFLQATFADGSIQTANAQISRECISPEGTPSNNENENSGGGFCLISSLRDSITDFSVFSIANAIPMVGLQFLQVKFAGIGSVSAPSLSSITECLSSGGSTAQAVSGFCLASDLSTSTVESANFSIAHNAPVTDLQFLQVTFNTDGVTGGLLSTPGFGAPIGAECISVDGSIAVTGNPEGFCLVSDLIGLTGYSAISVVNDLPVSGLQFLQVKFTNAPNGTPPTSGFGAPIGTECISAEGSIAATGNAEGFCLVSDLINPTIGLANFSIANDLPVESWEFLQVPSEDVTPFSVATNGTPTGVVVSDFIPQTFDLQTPSSALAGIAGLSPALVRILRGQMKYFHLSDQTNGMEGYSTPYWRSYPHLGLWTGR